jgi:peptidoglycan LD-endopeptidase CwlK
VVLRAAELSDQEFVVLEGVRTPERQKQLLSQGKTQTLKSNHITGNAVDLVPKIDGKISWDWKYFYPLADIMDKAADELDIKLTWGSAWNGTTEDWDNSKKAQEEYVRIRRSAGKDAFLDGPHWEIPKEDQNMVDTIDFNKTQRIKALQKLVNQFGANITEDGIIGRSTKEAVSNFLEELM